jgi:hypothetical protein
VRDIPARIGKVAAMTESVTPVGAGFYVTGGTVPRDAPSYVPRDSDEELFRGLRDGQFCYVLSPRQMGKSSLMVRCADRLRKNGVTCLLLDLTSIGQNLSAEEWYDGLLNLLARQLNLEDKMEEFWRSNSRLGPLQRWMGALRDLALPSVPGRLVIFVDEIDTVRSLPFSADEFFAAIRDCHNRRNEEPDFERLTFCLLGVATPIDLIRDMRTTPFNIGRRINLNDFTPREAAPLGTGLSRPQPVADRLLTRILFWTGGHPYLTQKLCHEVAEDRAITTPGGVDALADRLFVAPSHRHRDDNLLFVEERLLRAEVDRTALLDLYQSVLRGKRVEDDQHNPLVRLLWLSGITHSDRGRLSVRNRIYAQVFDGRWVRANIPGAEMRRQQAGYRRSLLAMSLFAVAVIAGMCLMGWSGLRKLSSLQEQIQHMSHQTASAGHAEVKQSLENGRDGLNQRDKQQVGNSAIKPPVPAPGAAAKNSGGPADPKMANKSSVQAGLAAKEKKTSPPAVETWYDLYLEIDIADAAMSSMNFHLSLPKGGSFSLHNTDVGGGLLITSTGGTREGMPRQGTLHVTARGITADDMAGEKFMLRIGIHSRTRDVPFNILVSGSDPDVALTLQPFGGGEKQVFHAEEQKPDRPILHAFTLHFPQK